MRHRLGAISANVALALTVTVLCVGVGETVAKWRERSHPPPETARYITDWAAWDGDFYTVKSTAVGWPPWEDYNRDGVRDREHELHKPPGVHRVICLGDSVTLGYGLRPGEAYPQVLQDRADARGLSLEVFNVGLGGWATRQERIAYERICRKYRPDDVLLGLCLNDIAEMRNNLTRPPPLLMDLYRYSAVVRWAIGAPDREIHDVEELFTRADSSKVRDGFARVFDEIRRLHALVKVDGGRLILLVFPFQFQVVSEAPSPTAQEAVAHFGAREGLSVLDLLPTLRSVGEGAFRDYDHFSASGARLVAETVLDSGLLGTGPRSATDERVAAVWALASPGTHDVSTLSTLVHALDDPDARVRAAAARALGALGPVARPAVPALVTRLADTMATVRWRATQALLSIGIDAASLPSLVDALRAADGRARAGAADVLARLGRSAAPAVPALAEALRDERDDVRLHVASALVEIGPDAASAVPALITALDRAETRWRVVDALAAIGPTAAPAVPALASALSDESSSVRWRAAKALGHVGAAASVAAPMLEKAARDPLANVRLAAVKALGLIDAPQPALDRALTQALLDVDSRVRLEALRALRKRPLTTEATSAAERLLASEVEEDVRREARKALQQQVRR